MKKGFFLGGRGGVSLLLLSRAAFEIHKQQATFGVEEVSMSTVDWTLENKLSPYLGVLNRSLKSVFGISIALCGFQPFTLLNI